MYRRGGTLEKREAYTRCSGSQKKDIKRVLPIAKDYVNSSIQYLQNLTAGSPRFENWFGTFLLAYYATVPHLLDR
jgi:hypothetical protein